jgi:hypothetical protein
LVFLRRALAVAHFGGRPEPNREILMLAAECQELQAKLSLIRTAIEPLEVAFAAIMKANGYKKAEE